MKSGLKRYIAAGAAVAVIAAVAVALGVSSSSATTPPYEPDPNAVGTISFYNSSGAPISGGNVSDSPMAAYFVGSSMPTGSAGSQVQADIEFCTPISGEASGNWSCDQASAFTKFSPVSNLSGAPTNIQGFATAGKPVQSGASGDEAIGPASVAGTIESDFPNPAASSSTYFNLYQIRLFTANALGTQSTTYDDADVLVSGTTSGSTFTIVYPTPVAGPTTTTTTLTTTPSSPQVSGTSVTLKATVSPSTAVGSVQFTDNGSAIGSPVAVSGGIASFPTTALPVGTDSLGAVFTPTNSANFTASTATAVSYTITSPATPTTTSLMVSPASPITVGTTTDLTANVLPNTAAGTIQFKDGSTNLGSAITVVSGAASLTGQSLALGSHPLTAVFTPTNSATFGPSTSATTTYVVNPVPATSTTTGLMVSPTSPAAYGATVTMTASVLPTTAVGAVQFYDGSTAIGSPVPVSSGTAAFNTSTLTSGVHSLKATFVPTNPANFGTSSSTATSYTISPQTTTMTIAASPTSPQNQGTTVTVTATLSPTTAAGTVQFTVDGSNVGSPVTVASGHAAYSTSTLSIATHSFGASFTPTDSTKFTAATATAISYVIQKPPPGATTTTLTVTPGSPVLTSTPTVTLKATVSPSAAAGTVQFMDGSTNLGSPVTVSGGIATYATSGSTLGLGSHPLKAVYTPGATANYNGSMSATYTLVVNAPPTPTTTTVTATPALSAQEYHKVTLTATVTPTAAAGKVQFSDNGKNIGSAVAVSAGSASASITFTSTGSQTFKAVFTPTSAAAYTSSSGSLNYSVTAPTTTSNVSASQSGKSLGGDPTITDGTSVALTIIGLSSSEVLDITLYSSPINLGTVKASTSGTAAYAFTVPGTLSAGQHTLVFTDSVSGAVVAVFRFIAKTAAAVATGTPTSTASATATATSTSTGGHLANTGSDDSGMVELALLMLGAGVVIMLGFGTRRWHRPSHAQRPKHL